jgi:hypothetical protein
VTLSPPHTRTPRLLSSAFRGLLLLLLASSQAHASLLRACDPSDTVLVCRLRSVLTLLTTAAGILGALLLFAVLAAVRAYRRKPRKLSPDDINSESR